MNNTNVKPLEMLKEIYLALPAERKKLMKPAERILSSGDHDDKTSFRIYMVFYRQMMVSNGWVNRDTYGTHLTSATTTDLWKEAQMLYKSLTSRKGVVA